MERYSKREPRKPKTALSKGKRYRCCVCRKRAMRKTTVVPYYCDRCIDASGISRPALRVGAVEYWASIGDATRTLEVIQAGADVNATSSGNSSPLHVAAANGHRDIVLLLLRHGANRSNRLSTGETAADLAKLGGFQELADLLTPVEEA